MAFLFSRSSRQKNPQELVRLLKDSLHRLETASDSRRATDEITRTLAQMKVVLNGDLDTEPAPDQIALLAQESYNTDLLQTMIVNLGRLDFELRKDVTTVFNTLLQRQIGQRFPTVEYLSTHERVTHLLMKGYEKPEIAMNCGQILRECIKHEPLAKIALGSSLFWNFFDYVQVPAFETASDAFTAFKDLLTRHKATALEFLTQHTDAFFQRFNGLLASSNYVTKRQSIKLLGEILLDRTNYVVMTAYIDSPEHLKLVMNLLRDRSRNIQYESFHVFKVFVANPNKSKPVLEILVKNKAKLLEFLRNFQNDREDDEQFSDEKRFLIREIQEFQ
ncbi:Mo25-like protein [Dipodascopsis tothii]|uniref:Mo25-like protein n=1 Tax=Dipodascopsis tothii TaxID=44089 RepID=UPI0034CF0140